MADQFSQVVPHEPTTAQRVSYFIHAVAAVAAPVYLCHSLYGLPIEDYFIYFIVATVAAATLLSIAYHNLAYHSFVKLWNKRDSIITAKAVQAVDGKKDVTSHKQEQANNTANEATSSSYLRVNVAFIVLYLCASALFIKFTPIVNYLIATLAPAAVIAFVSTASNKK